RSGRLMAMDLAFSLLFFFFFQAEDGIRDRTVTGVQTCALPILPLPLSFDFRGLRHVDRPAPLCTRSLEVNQAVDTPEYNDSQSDIWFFGTHSGHHERSDERSEEHTSELQSPYDLVCRLLLEKKKAQQRYPLDLIQLF